MRLAATTLPPYLLAAGLGIAFPLSAGAMPPAQESVLARGRELAFEPTKGNCLACHDIEAGESPGDLGPPLVAIQARFPQKDRLRRQLWNPLEDNPNSRMPPFGLHRILTEDEIDMVVEFIYSL